MDLSSTVSSLTQERSSWVSDCESRTSERAQWDHEREAWSAEREAFKQEAENLRGALEESRRQNLEQMRISGEKRGRQETVEEDELAAKRTRP